jgi:hypothetical protein
MGTENQIDKIFEALLPEVEVRQQCLHLLADYIIYAHNQIHPAIWATTIRQNALDCVTPSRKSITYKNPQRLITLNVGDIPVYGIYAPGMYDKNYPPENRFVLNSSIILVLNCKILTDDDIRELKSQEISSNVYDSQSKYCLRNTVIDSCRLNEVSPLIHRVYKSSLDKAAKNPSGMGYYDRAISFKDYSVDIVTYLREFLGRDIPEPIYNNYCKSGQTI